MLVDLTPVLVHHLHRHRSLASGDGNRQAGRHIFGDAQRGTPQRDQLIAFGHRDRRRVLRSDSQRPGWFRNGGNCSRRRGGVAVPL